MSAAPRVLVAHESDALREVALRILEKAGYRCAAAANGAALLAGLEPEPPEALVLDVALPGLVAFEACDEIRRRGLAIRIVLIASVYSHTSYKRRPSSLYGADDYVEQHHVPDMLLPKIVGLVGRPQGGQADEQAPGEPANSGDERALREAGEARLELGAGAATCDRALRLARIFLADIILYNGDEVEKGLVAGDLERRLARDLAEGRSLLAARVPASLIGGRDLLGEVLGEYEGFRRGGGVRGSWPAGAWPVASSGGRSGE